MTGQAGASERGDVERAAEAMWRHAESEFRRVEVQVGPHYEVLWSDVYEPTRARYRELARVALAAASVAASERGNRTTVTITMTNEQLEAINYAFNGQFLAAAQWLLKIQREIGKQIGDQGGRPERSLAATGPGAGVAK